MAYASSSDVGILSPHLLAGASDFSSSSSPTQTAVNSWLSSGSAIINAKLASKGYSSIGATSGAYGIAQQTNALYGAWMAEISLVSARVAKSENTRADMFKKNFWDLLDMLCELDLSNMGVGRGNAPPANYGGGISRSDKDTTESDSDRVTPRFERGQFENIDTLMPISSTPNSRQTRNDG